MRIKELPEEQWTLIHKLNGQLIDVLKHLLIEKVNWNVHDWIVTVLVLQRTVDTAEEAVLKTSSTMFRGEIVDEKGKCNAVGDLNRIVPLVKSFAGYCIRSGNVLWVDDIKQHPLRDEYRPHEYVDIRPGRRLVAEYVFPIRVRIGLGQAVLGVLNAETDSENGNEFKAAGLHRISELLLPLLDTHGPFMLLSEIVKPDSAVRSSLLKAHSKVLESAVDGIKNSMVYQASSRMA